MADRELYDTTIKDIAGLKDYSAVYQAIEAYYTDESSLDDLFVGENLFDIRTEKGRKKAAWAVEKAILSFKNQDHKDLIGSAFKQAVPSQDKAFFLLWQLAINNRLIREITGKVFVKTYYSGRATISVDDIIGYIKEIPNDQKLSRDKDWATETIYRIATRYLSLMTKLGFLSSGRVKSFKHIRPSSETQVLFLYFAKVFSPSTHNILVNEFLPVSFIPADDVQERLKKLSLKGFFNMNFNGFALNIELTHSYKGICDVLYN